MTYEYDELDYTMDERKNSLGFFLTIFIEAHTIIVYSAMANDTSGVSIINLCPT